MTANGDSGNDVRFGLVGFGAWGQHHADAITKQFGANLVAVATRSEASAESARSAYPDAWVTTDYREMLARTDIDVVDIVVPSNRHHEIAAAVLASGKHVLLEKPMGVAVSECDDLIRVAKENKRLLAIGHEFRLSSLWGEVKTLIDDGFVGRPQYALVELSRNAYRQGADGWRYDINRVGNWILEEPIHFFDLARWYLSDAGEPTKVYAAANSRQADHPELQDNFSSIIHFENDAYAVVSQSLSAFEHHQTVKVTGTKGALWASWSGAMDRTRHPTFALRGFDGETVQDIPVPRVTGELFELEDQIGMLVEAIRNGTPLSCSAEDGRWSVVMCLAAQASVDSGQPIDVANWLAADAN